MKFANDPFAVVFRVVRNKYPNLKAKVMWTNDIQKYAENNQEVIGLTIFPPNKRFIPVVLIDTGLSIPVATYILAHELAHVICGRDEEHGVKWEKTFDWIIKSYEKELKKL